MNSIFSTLFYFSTWFYCKTVVFPEVCNCHFYFIHKTKVLIRFSSRPALYIVSSKAQSSHFFPKELPPTEPLPPLKLPSFSTAADNGHPRTFLYYSVAWVLWEILSIIFIISLWKRTPSFNWAYCHLIQNTVPRLPHSLVWPWGSSGQWDGTRPWYRTPCKAF